MKDVHLARADAVRLFPDDPSMVLRRMGVYSRDEPWHTILKRDPCAYCGGRGEMTIDHIVPRARGYARAGVANGAPACFTCNQAKQDDSLLELLSRSIPVPPSQLPACIVFVSRTAKRHAHLALGSVPPEEWWEAVAERVVARSLRATWVKRAHGSERVWWVLPLVSQDGVDVDMLVLTRTFQQQDERLRVEFLKVGKVSVVGHVLAVERAAV